MLKCQPKKRFPAAIHHHISWDHHTGHRKQNFTRYFWIYISICPMYIYRCKNAMKFDHSLWFQNESRACVVLQLFTSMYLYLSIRSFLFIIFCAKLLHKLVKTLWIIFLDYVHSAKLVYVRCCFEAAIASIFSCQHSLDFLENVLSINRSSCGFSVSMSNPSFLYWYFAVI